MKKHIVFVCVFILSSCALHTAGPEKQANSEPVTLGDVVQEIQSVFTDIQADIQQAAGDISDAQSDNGKIRGILRRIQADHPYAADVSFVDADGRMRIVEPAGYRRFQGSDISGQKHIRQMIIDRKPSLSESFNSIEGFPSAALQYPILHENTFIGSVDMLLRPEALLKNIIEPLTRGLPVDIWVMEPGGRILYDPDQEEIDRNIFTDKLYKPFPGLLEAARLMSHDEKGTATYEFMARNSKDTVKKYAYWTTVSMYGTPWRIVLTKAEKQGVNGKKTLEELGIKELNEAFREFVALDEMQDAIGRKDKKYLIALFQEFFTNNPGLYCVSWVNEKCVTRFGYPPENSLHEYKFNSEKNPEQIEFIRAVKAGKEARFEMPLMEGNIGEVMLCPVRPRGKYRGMVYYLRIKP